MGGCPWFAGRGSWVLPSQDSNLPLLLVTLRSHALPSCKNMVHVVLQCIQPDHNSNLLQLPPEWLAASLSLSLVLKQYQRTCMITFAKALPSPGMVKEKAIDTVPGADANLAVQSTTCFKSLKEATSCSSLMLAHGHFAKPQAHKIKATGCTMQDPWATWKVKLVTNHLGPTLHNIAIPHLCGQATCHISNMYCMESSGAGMGAPVSR